MYGIDPNRPVEELLSEIQHAALGGNAKLIGAVLTPFATLMVKLSRDAEAGAERMERLTRRLYFLTVLILALTLLLLIREIAKDAFEFYEKRRPQHQSEQQPKQNPGINNRQKTGEPVTSTDLPIVRPTANVPEEKKE